MVKKIWVALVMVLVVSAILLFSDTGNRKQNKAQSGKKIPSIAVLQFSTALLQDSHVAGVIDRLKTRGCIAPDRNNLHRFNANGELTVARAISDEVLNGSYDIVITSSTMMLQTFATANAKTGKKHVFGAVTDPYGTGMGITGKNPGDHPPHLAGIGSFQPVMQAFRIARFLNPGLRRVGVVWNPGEQCSTACLFQAREICKILGIKLIEETAVNTNEVSDAVHSLLSKGVEAIWIGSDTVATGAAKLIIRHSKEAHIPIFTNDPVDADNGALFGLGADYFTVGQYTGDMAADILEGKDPATIRIENIVPEKLNLNQEVLSWLGKPWAMADSVMAILYKTSQDKVNHLTIDFAFLKAGNKSVTTDELEKAEKVHNLHVKNGRMANVALITIVESHNLEQAIAGVETGMKEFGLTEGKDFAMKKYSAQGEIGQLSTIIDVILLQKPDAIVTVSTPALIAAANKVSEIPVIFTVSSQPERIGIFKEGRPSNICGIYDNPRMNELLQMAVRFGNGLKKAGTIFDPSQINSMISVERLREAGKNQGIEILEAPVSTVSDLPMATQSLVDRGAQALLLSADNLVSSGFTLVNKAAKVAKIPVYVTDMDHIKQGADGGIGVNYFDWGFQSGILAAKVLAGVPPGRLPCTETNDEKIVEPK